MISILLLSLLAASGSNDEARISYRVSFENAAHHEARISVTLRDVPAGPLEMCMSRSSPGRYALHEFAKNVHSVSALDGQGRKLELLRPNNHRWQVLGHDGSLTLSYTLFADRADGTYSQVDPSHAHLNMPATFMWPRGMDTSSIEVSFVPPQGSGWKVATQLYPGDSEMSFRAPSLQYFMDSPTELSDFSLRQWQVTEADGRQRTIRMAVHHAGTEAEVDSFVADTQKLVLEQRAVFGELPDFDGGNYTFIADYLGHASGDGMEHRNSTILSSDSSLELSAERLIRTVSHEFFHCWNVERIRPATLEPFDFERANMSRELWFAEGFTSYYDKLFMRRAGLVDDDGYIELVAPGLLQVLETPALGYDSPVGMSMQAPFVDRAASADPHNRANTFISYYTLGAALGLALDLTLRTRFEQTLDDFMRLAWQRFGRPEIPYVVEDLEALLGEFTQDASFAKRFFDEHVRGQKLPDFKALLSHAGILLYQLDFDMSSLDYSQFAVSDAGVEVLEKAIVGTPFYEAGVDQGALITSFNGEVITTEEGLKRMIQAFKPGAKIKLEFIQRGVRGSGLLQVGGPSSLHLSTFENAWARATKDQLDFRAAWLGSRAGN